MIAADAVCELHEADSIYSSHVCCARYLSLLFHMLLFSVCPECDVKVARSGVLLARSDTILRRRVF